MAPDDLGEGILGVLRGVAGQQVRVGIVHLTKVNEAGSSNPPKNFYGIQAPVRGRTMSIRFGCMWLHPKALKSGVCALRRAMQFVVMLSASHPRVTPEECR